MSTKRSIWALLGLLAIPATLTAQTPVRVGQTVSGQLASGDPLASDNTLYDDFVLQGSPGQRVTIRANSSAFDVFLLWGSGTGSAFRQAGTDDDGGGGTNSLGEATVGSDGRLTIRVNALSEGMSGAYSLSVTGAGGGQVGQRPPAQQGGGPQPLAAGQTVRGRLDGTDPALDDQSHYDLYVYRGQPGERITVTMRSADFDTYLAGGSGESLTDTDDDGAGGTDSRLEATLGSGGAYVVRANSLVGGETGAYTLTVTSTRTATQPVQQSGGVNTVAAGQTVRGRLERSDPMLADTSYYDTWVVRGQPGEQLSITLTSSDFDTFMLWGRVTGNNFQALATDDDGGGGTNSRLEVELDGTGTYAVRANSYAKRMTGEYTIAVERTTLTIPSNVQTVALGQTVNGRLDANDPKLGDNSHFDLYMYRGRPGEQVIIALQSSAFDAFLASGRFVGSRVEVDESDDDGGGGTNSQVVATVGASGVLAIRANSFSGGETGAYTLRLQPVGAGGPPQPAIPAGAATITAGQTVTGTLARGDAMLGDSSYADRYVYRGRPGDRLVITLRSTAFDAFVRWGRLSGDAIVNTQADDDGAGGSDSQLTVTVGGSGLYAVEANSLLPQQTGSYTLTVGAAEGPVVSAPRPGAPAAQTPSTRSSGGGAKWRSQYAEPTQPRFRPLGQTIKQAQLLEQFADQLNTRFPGLTNPVDLRLAECGMVNAFFSPRDNRVTFCYELLQYMSERFGQQRSSAEDLRERMNGAFSFIMYHEIGHALIHNLDIPALGREEDVVDQFATWMLVTGEGDKGARAALSGVQAIQSGSTQVSDAMLADEHALDRQRYFNVLCWIYGSDRAKWHAAIVGQGLLPSERAVRCPGEYDRLSKSWERLLAQAHQR